MISISLGEIFLLSLELAVYLAGMLSYLILFRGVIAKLWLPNVKKKVVVAVGWFVIALLNDVTRYYFPQRLNSNKGTIYPSTFILNTVLSIAILVVYLWLEKNQSKDKS